MTDPTITPELQIEMRMDAVLRELDEFCRMAVNEETVDLINNERVAVGQILTRAQLVADFIMRRRPNLKVVRHG